VELVRYLDNDNVQIVDDILTTVQAYLRNTPVDFTVNEPPATISAADESPSPLQSSTAGNRTDEPEVDYMQVDTAPVYSKKKARESTTSTSLASQTPTNTAATSATTSTSTRVTRTRGANANSINKGSSHISTPISNTAVANVSTNTNTSTTDTSTASGNESAVKTNRKVYKLPLTQEQKELINSGKAPLPVGEVNTDFDNNVHGLCGQEACKYAVEAWWSSLASPQLVSVSDFKKQVAQIRACSKCYNPKNCSTILRSLSQLQSVLVKAENYKKVDFFEIKRKVN